MLNYFIINIFKKIIKSQDIIKTGDLNYKSKRRKFFNFTE